MFMCKNPENPSARYMYSKLWEKWSIEMSGSNRVLRTYHTSNLLCVFFNCILWSECRNHWWCEKWILETRTGWKLEQEIWKDWNVFCHWLHTCNLIRTCFVAFLQIELDQIILLDYTKIRNSNHAKYCCKSGRGKIYHYLIWPKSHLFSHQR